MSTVPNIPSPTSIRELDGQAAVDMRALLGLGPEPHTVLGPAAPVGLSSADAERRLAEFGRNEIRRERSTTPITLLARQFASPVIWLLVAASVLSAALGEVLDAAAIGAIVLVNAAIGFFQEHRAERAVMALRSMTAPRARVMRDGHSLMRPADVVVPAISSCSRPATSLPRTRDFTPRTH